MVPALALGAAAYIVLRRSGPVMTGAEINAVPALAACFLALSVAAVVSELFLLAGGLFGYLEAKTPTGHKGTSGWVKSLRDIKKDLTQKGDSPYWGAFRGAPVMADFESNAMCVAPSRSGKGVSTVLPNLLSIRADKIHLDMKGENTACTKKALKARGEIVRTLDLSGQFENSDRYNPLDLIADNLERPRGLMDVVGELSGMAKQLCPDPTRMGGSGDNKYFTNGAQDLIAWGKLQCVLTYHRKATLGEVRHMLSNRSALHREAEWACGRLEIDGKPHIMPIENLPWVDIHAPEDVRNLIEYHRDNAAALCDLLDSEESRTLNIFLTEAQQELRPFNKTSRAAKLLRDSTFRFHDTKTGDGTTTIGITVDTTRMDEQKSVVALLLYCATTELKRAKDKKRPVYFICDEATNFKIHDLPSLLTWGGGYGLRLLLIFQSLSAFVTTYGEEALNVLLSETEIKQFLPGQREPRVLSLIKKLLAERSVVVKNHNGRMAEGFGIGGYGYKEDGRALMTEDEIRRTDKALLFVRNNKPLKVDTPPYAAIAPWRHQMNVNPFYGKPFRLPVKLRIPRKFLRKRGRQ